MIKRVTSIIVIVLLLTLTGFPYTSLFFNTPVYAATTLTNSQQANLVLATYFSSRNGWFTSSSPDHAVQYMRDSFQEYLDTVSDPIINSVDQLSGEFVEFASIPVPDVPNAYNWQLHLPRATVGLLNGFADWYVKNHNLPGLYDSANDTWGDSDVTNNTVYSGFYAGTGLFYVAEYNSNTVQGANKSFIFKSSDVTKGTNIGGILGRDLYGQFVSTYSISDADFFNPNKDNNSLNLLNKTISVTVPYFADVDTTFRCYRSTSISSNSSYPYSPSLSLFDRSNTAYDYSGMSSTVPVYGLNLALYSYRDLKVNSNPCNMILKNSRSGVNKFCSGWAIHDITNHICALYVTSVVERNDIAESTINFRTDHYNKEDTPDSADGQDYIPKNKTTGDTYDGDENDFYDDMIGDFTGGDTTTESPQPPPVGPPDGGTVPDWGDQPNNPGTIQPTTPPGGGDTVYHFELPDFNLPDLNIDWKINGLQKKFPFSIPWDLMAFFTVLNADPETPELSGTIDLGIVNWVIDWDLHNFDTLASILRNLEFIGFCLALILITRNIIKG